MPYHLILHPEAELELYESIIWYEQVLIGLGSEFLKNIERVLHHIYLHPLIYAKRKKNFREAVVKRFPFVIIYKVNKLEKEVHILSIFHTSQNPKMKYTRE